MKTKWSEEFCDSFGRPDELETAPIIRSPDGDHYRSREALIQYCIERLDESFTGPWVEFGVREGRSARWMLERLPPNEELHLFDSWDGLPEAWDVGMVPGREDTLIKPKGKGLCDLPKFADPRVVIHKGLFEETLPEWDSKGWLPFVNIDCDLYSSTVTVLDAIGPRLKRGSIVIFDELIGYPNWRDGEYKALTEWASMLERDFEYIGRTRWFQAAVRILA